MQTGTGCRSPIPVDLGQPEKDTWLTEVTGRDVATKCAGNALTEK